MRKIITKTIGFVLLTLSLSACTQKEKTPASETPKTYEVIMSEGSSDVKSSAVETLAEIRPSVVDVTSTSSSGVSSGSGVIIAGAGQSQSSYEQYFIVTNHHVISDGTSFKVDVLTIESDGSESTTAYNATLIGSSLKRDIAVLSVRPPKGTVFQMATFISDSDTVSVGTEVYAIGNPLGILGGTVTHGIVSATQRTVSVGEIGSMTLMQTDASINGGNSGGGLFDKTGKLIGIINSGYDTYNNQSVEGLNFAIPANDAKYAVQKLIETHEEENDVVTKYGYVQGDVQLDLTYSTASLYDNADLSSGSTYLVAGASSTTSPVYSAWQNNTKVLTAITINETKYPLTEEKESSYSLTSLADEILAKIKAEDEVVFEYRDILSKSLGGLGHFGMSYYYVDSTVKTCRFVAEQYIYEPNIA